MRGYREWVRGGGMFCMLLLHSCVAQLLSMLQAYEAERVKVRAMLVETLPETGAKAEVIACYMEGRLSVAALSIEGKLALEMEGERAEMREAAKVSNKTGP